MQGACLHHVFGPVVTKAGDVTPFHGNINIYFRLALTGGHAYATDDADIFVLCPAPVEIKLPVGFLCPQNFQLAI